MCCLIHESYAMLCYAILCLANVVDIVFVVVVVVSIIISQMQISISLITIIIVSNAKDIFIKRVISFWLNERPKSWQTRAPTWKLWWPTWQPGVFQHPPTPHLHCCCCWRENTLTVPVMSHRFWCRHWNWLLFYSEWLHVPRTASSFLHPLLQNFPAFSIFQDFPAALRFSNFPIIRLYDFHVQMRPKFNKSNNTQQLCEPNISSHFSYNIFQFPNFPIFLAFTFKSSLNQ